MSMVHNYSEPATSKLKQYGEVLFEVCFFTQYDTFIWELQVMLLQVLCYRFWSIRKILSWKAKTTIQESEGCCNHSNHTTIQSTQYPPKNSLRSSNSLFGPDIRMCVYACMRTLIHVCMNANVLAAANCKKTHRNASGWLHCQSLVFKQCNCLFRFFCFRI